jgi:hypothetical protein
MGSAIRRVARWFALVAVLAAGAMNAPRHAAAAALVGAAIAATGARRTAVAALVSLLVAGALGLRVDA